MLFVWVLLRILILRIRVLESLCDRPEQRQYKLQLSRRIYLPSMFMQEEHSVSVHLGRCLVTDTQSQPS